MRRGALLVLVLLLAACGSDPTPAGGGRVPLRITTAVGEVGLRVEIADSPEERVLGLMGRTALGADSGMAFLWDEPIQATFWMKNTLIPLQIAFWDERGRIVAIMDMDPCPAEPCPEYEPSRAVVGAVEANAEWFTDHGVRRGDTVELDAGDA